MCGGSTPQRARHRLPLQHAGARVLARYTAAWRRRASSAAAAILPTLGVGQVDGVDHAEPPIANGACLDRL